MYLAACHKQALTSHQESLFSVSKKRKTFTCNMRRRPPSPRALTRSLPWYALAALITVTLYWNFDAHVEAHGEPGVDLRGD